MPRVVPYIPTKQSLFDVWFLNFSTLITLSPATYGLVAADATVIANLYTTWHAAYLLTTSPTTKSASNVSAKNAAYAACIGQVRAYAQQIANNAGVSNNAKIALGLNPKTSTPTPITAPTSNPVLTFQSASIGQATLRYRDSAAAPSGKGKPYGVIQLLIMGMTSLTPIVTPASLPQIAVATKSPLILPTTGFTSGLTLYVAAYWATLKGLRSPPSPILSFTVP
jgi:hypothetical protein